jgi:CheY-like chemotaxis protein
MSLHVLVVDDILASRCAVAALVRELGHEAVEAASGREAVAYLATHHPDLVLLDLLMPDMDGFAVIRAVRAQSAGRWLPVIVTSALEGEEHFIHALEQGADDYLQRPVSPGLLRAKLQHYAEVLALQARLATGAQRQRDILDNILDPVLTFGPHLRRPGAHRRTEPGRPGADRSPGGRPAGGRPL